MSKGKHTPGPWYQVVIDHRRWVSQQPEGGTFWIAEVASGVMGDEEEANGRLIAASPDLFDFIEKALPIIEREAKQRQNWGERHNTEGHPYATEMRDLADEIEVLILKVKGEL